MSVHTQYYVACDNCNRQLVRKDGDHYGETSEEAMEIAENTGWVYERVQNGSMWHICPMCLELVDGDTGDVAEPD